MAQVNDAGTAIRLTVKDQDGSVVPVDSATLKEIHFKKPDNSVVLKTAAFTTDGTDGKIQYVTIAGDLDLAGVWYCQGYVEFGGSHWYTDTHVFRVEKNL